MKEYGVAFAAYEIGEKAYEKIPETVGIPTCLADEKLPSDRAYLAPALDAVPEDEDMAVIPYPVTPDMVFRAICAVEDLA